MAYFDWNATAPLLPEAHEAWLEAVERYWANPSTPYRLGARARAALDEAREYLAEQMGVDPEEVLFTSGATEANNGILRGFADRAAPGDIVWISAAEHPSVREAARAWWGADRVVEIPVGQDGAAVLDWVTDRLPTGRPALVCVMAANNETGVIQPWREIRDLCREHGVPFHCDAVQWIGKGGRENWKGLAGVTVSAHKLGGPKGVGCLILGDQHRGLRILAGGSQEQDSRAGTENVPGILSMVAAVRKRLEGVLPDNPSQARDRFEAGLEKAWPGELKIHGAGAERLWNTSSLCLPKYRSERWIAQLDRLGFQVSSGSACSTGHAGPSPVLRAMGVPDTEIRRTLRVSGGWESTAQDWHDLSGALLAARQSLAESEPPEGPGSVIEI